MLIYLIRHARPDGVEGLCYGRRDIRVHREETARAARELRARLPDEVLNTAPVHSSPLARCAALAHELAPARPVSLTPALLELDFGSWEGCAWDTVPRTELDAWAEEPWRYAPGGGESAHSAGARWAIWAERMRNEGHVAVIAVTHAGLIRVALSLSSGESALGRPIGYGSVHAIALSAAARGPSHAQQAGR